jgi:cellulose biosynthesis protein BcsQ
VRILATYNIKGGVGKTATAVNLAYLSAASGARTLLWDLDPQGAATFYLRVQQKVRGGAKKLVRGRRPLREVIRSTDFDGLDLLPSDFSYRNLDLLLDARANSRKRLARLVKPLAAYYDHVYLDCAPGISLVSEGIFFAADALLVPTMPTTLSMRTLDQLTVHLEADGPRKPPLILPFFCIVDARKSLHREVCAQPDGRFRFLETRIPYSSTVEKMGLRRAPVPVYASRSEAARAYEQLWFEVIRRTGSLLAWIGQLPRRIGMP